MGWRFKEAEICKDTICRKEQFWQKNEKTSPYYMSSVLEKFQSHGYEIKINDAK